MENVPPGETGKSNEAKKSCRACTDFKSWFKMKNNGDQSTKAQEGANSDRTHIDGNHCPLDKDDLGRNTWSLLHTMAAYYPDKPTVTQEKEMTVFMKLFAKYYPCDHCAKDFRVSMKKAPPETNSRWDFSQWLCRMHNEVNRKLGKDEFDCRLVDQRWKDGWDDGSCG